MSVVLFVTDIGFAVPPPALGLIPPIVHFFILIISSLLNQLFAGKIRMRLLSRILINPMSKVYLRQLQKELNVSSNTVRIELNKLAEMKLIETVTDKTEKVKKYSANTLHPLYRNLREIVFKYIGVDHLIDDVFFKLGNIDEVYLIGDIAEGKDSLFIDLLVVGNIDRIYFNKLIEKAELLLGKKIRTAFYERGEFNQQTLNNMVSVCIFKAETNFD
jgi:hypothetical protein